MIPLPIERVVVVVFESTGRHAGKAKLTKRSVARTGANLARRLENHSTQQHSRNLGTFTSQIFTPNPRS